MPAAVYFDSPNRNRFRSNTFRSRHKLISRTTLINDIFAAMVPRGNDDDFDLERMENVSAGGPRRKYRGPDYPGHLRSSLCSDRRSALLRGRRQCRPGAVATPIRYEVL